jgi:hypothetical protein
MAHTATKSLQIVIDAANSGKPLLTILSRMIDFDRLHMLEPVLPFRADNVIGSELQIFAAVPEAQQNSPVLNIGSAAKTVELWSKLPPVFRMQGIYHPKIESEILVTVYSKSSRLVDPFIVARNVNKRKSLSVLGYGLWRWNMLSDDGTGTEQILNKFLSNATRWLTTLEDERRIRIQPVKHSFTTQDAIEFSAQVYDDNFQPVDNAQVEVYTRIGSETNYLILNALGNGQYQGAYDHLHEGDFKFTATVAVNGTAIGSDQGSFSIGGSNAEFLETQMNRSMLRQIAAQTGGRYYDSNRIDSLNYDIVTMPFYKSRDMIKSAEIEMWNSRWMLGVIILVFVLEWFLRKKYGML